MRHIMRFVSYHTILLMALLFGALLAHDSEKFGEAVLDNNIDNARTFAQLIDLNKELGIRTIEESNKLADLLKNFERPVPLGWAAFFNRKEIVEFLLIDPRLDINAKTTRGITALHAAIAGGNADMVKLLLQNGASPKDEYTQVFIDGMGLQEKLISAIDFAESLGHKDIVALLKNPPPIRGFESGITSKLRDFSQALKSLEVQLK